MAYLGKNDVLEAVTEPKLLKGLVRVLWVDKRSDQIVLMTIERSPKRPWVMQLSELKRWLSSGDIKFLSVTPPTYMLKTEEDLSDKEKAFRDNPDIRVCLLNLDSGGTGLNLVSAAHLIFSEVPWTSAAFDQVKARIDRIGQEADRLLYTVFLAADTPEGAKFGTVRKKSGLCDRYL